MLNGRGGSAEGGGGWEAIGSDGIGEMNEGKREGSWDLRHDQ